MKYWLWTSYLNCWRSRQCYTRSAEARPETCRRVCSALHDAGNSVFAYAVSSFFIPYASSRKFFFLESERAAFSRETLKFIVPLLYSITFNGCTNFRSYFTFQTQPRNRSTLHEPSLILESWFSPKHAGETR